ncbi:MerR family transcriptional regulator [Staphylococcus felis]
MEYQYSIKDMMEITGVTKRTLHYYDEIGLLSSSKNKNNYRVYNQNDLVKLQKILLLKSMNFDIKSISKLLDLDNEMFIECIKKQSKILDDKIKRLKTTKIAIDKFINGIPIIEIEELNHNINKQYQKEADMRYGKTRINKEFKTNLFEDKKIKNEFESIVYEFCSVTDYSVEDSKVFKVVLKWKGFMNQLFDFDDEMLCLIANVYHNDKRFNNYFEKFKTPGIAHFISKAVNYHLSSE